ncbi:hypothetical protein M1271_03675 [Patescibacteria group bacterium]|nr:hypothetical protein [Patescibacteria group bacterium]MCL5797807.1 hypothetical protein [Patescibacteria group bacterium]
MSRKIVISGLSILASLALLGVGVYAALVSTATATSNTFSSTNPSLLISTNNTTFNTTVGGVTESGIIPGGTPVVHDFWLQNTDTDPGATMNLTATINVTGGSGGSYNDNLSLTYTCGSTTAGPFSITAWNGHVPQSLGTLAPGGVVHCTLSTSLPSGDSVDAGKSVIFDTSFDGSVGS